jgi:hypothetical protein
MFQREAWGESGLLLYLHMSQSLDTDYPGNKCNFDAVQWDNSEGEYQLFDSNIPPAGGISSLVIEAAH